MRDQGRQRTAWLRPPHVAWVTRTLLVALAVAGMSEVMRRGTGLAYGQVFTPPQGRVENVSFEAAGGGVVNVYYDLVSDSPNALFSVTLQASEDGGRTFSLTPSAISGDVTGVKPGRRKKIVWQSGQDVAVLPGTNLLKFNVLATAGDLTPTAQPGQTPAPAAAPGGGGSKLKYILPIAAGGAVAAVLLAKKGSTPPPPCTFGVLPAAIDAATGGDTKTVTITVSPAGCSPNTWTATSSDFVTVSPTSGSGSGQVTLTITADAGAARTASVTVAGTTVAVSQVGVPVCTTITASPNPVTPLFSGGVSAVSLTLAPAGCLPNTWSVSATTNPGTFITGITPTTGSGNSAFTFNYTANGGSTARSGVLTITNPSSGAANATLALAVNQPPTSCAYAVNVNPATVGAAATSVNVTITNAQNCSWKASFNPNPSNFLSFNNMTSDGGVTATGTGTTTLMVKVAVFAGPGSRVGTVIVTDVATNTQKGSVNITQTFP